MRYSTARMGIRSTIRTGVTTKFDLAHVAPWPAFCHTRNKTRPCVFFIAGHSRVAVPQAEQLISSGGKVWTMGFMVWA